MRVKFFVLHVVVLLCSVLLSHLSFAAPNDSAGDPSGAEIAVDLLVARPAGAVVTVLGAGVWLVGLPFNAAGGNVKGSAETLMLEPLKTTFWRCLGCSNSGYKKD